MASVCRPICRPLVQGLVLPADSKDGPALAGGSGGGGDSYVAEAVHLDGSAYLSRAAGLAIDSPLLLYSRWFKRQAGVNSTLYFWVHDPEGNYMSSDGQASVGNGGAINIGLLSNDFAGNLATDTDGSAVSEGAWHNLLIAAKMDEAAGQKTLAIYLDDVAYDAAIVDNNASFSIDFDGVPLFFFTDTFGVAFTGDMADVYFAPGQFLDLTVEANRRKFIDANGKPVDLGADGSTPTGTAPAVFFSGDASGFATNKGTGGAFTLTGSLTNASTSPSD